MAGRAVAAQVAGELVPAGAAAVVLTGSWARGEAHAHSDIDVVVLGSGADRMRVVDGHLVVESWTTDDDVRALFRDPGAVGWAVPGWRSAEVLADPGGHAAALVRAAHAWRWEDLGDAPGAWVADQLAGFAEEVHRLVGHVLAGREMPAAVMRNVLANQLAVIVSVHLRLLYGTENVLWDRVAGQLGHPWATLQRAALGLDTGWADSCRAALQLYRQAAVLADGVLHGDQRSVVAAAVAVAQS